MLRRSLLLPLFLAAVLVTSCAASGKAAYQQQVRAADVGFRVYETVADGAAAKAAALVRKSRTAKLVDAEKDTLRKIQGLGKALNSYREFHNAYLGIVEFARRAQKNSVATDQEKKGAALNAEILRVRVETMTANLLKAADAIGISTSLLKGAEKP